MTKLWPLCFIVFSCGRIETTIDPRLELYVTEFERIYDVGNTSDVVIEPLPDPRNGLCMVRATSKKIIIDEDFYKAYGQDYNIMHQLMFHELGHCVLGLPHNSDLLPDGRPESIMYPYSFGHHYFYSAYMDYYIEELGR